jgi:RES domain-containing protein
MVYTSDTVALAVLEILVHLQNSEVLPAYSVIAVHFDEALMTRIDRSVLPVNWKDSPSPPELLAVGDAWIASRSSLILEVPSAIVEDQSNYLINPTHPHFASLGIDKPRPFTFDARLLR